MASALIASCLLIAASCLSSELIRIIINKNVETPLSKLLCLEFIASAELCAVCFELIVGKRIMVLLVYRSFNLSFFFVQKVSEEYGIWMYALILLLLTLWWAAHWADASACPYIHLEAYLDGSVHFSQAFLATLAEIAGGLAIYKCA